MMRLVWLFLGGLSLALAALGAVLPLMPTVPFLLLAAFCFARGHPPFETWLLDHPALGPPLRDWRARGAIGRRAKYAAIAGFTGSAILGLLFLPMPWMFAPAVIALAGGTWVWTRPE
ncbi:MAG TPA: YbaN family protein [Allosphingosinicella sp.]